MFNRLTSITIFFRTYHASAQTRFPSAYEYIYIYIQHHSSHEEQHKNNRIKFNKVDTVCIFCIYRTILGPVAKINCILKYIEANVRFITPPAASYSLHTSRIAKALHHIQRSQTSHYTTIFTTRAVRIASIYIGRYI